MSRSLATIRPFGDLWKGKHREILKDLDVFLAYIDCIAAVARCTSRRQEYIDDQADITRWIESSLPCANASAFLAFCLKLYPFHKKMQKAVEYIIHIYPHHAGHSIDVLLLLLLFLFCSVSRYTSFRFPTKGDRVAIIVDWTYLATTDIISWIRFFYFAWFGFNR